MICVSKGKERSYGTVNPTSTSPEIKAWLSVQKPLDLRNDNMWKEVQRISENTDEKNLHDFIANGSAQTDRFIDAVIKQGYDGIILPDAMAGGTEFTSWIVFDSTQIKSATDNIGTFDGTNPDIRFSLNGDAIDPKSTQAEVDKQLEREVAQVIEPELSAKEQKEHEKLVSTEREVLSDTLGKPSGIFKWWKDSNRQNDINPLDQMIKTPIWLAQKFAGTPLESIVNYAVTDMPADKQKILTHIMGDF